MIYESLGCVCVIIFVFVFVFLVGMGFLVLPACS